MMTEYKTTVGFIYWSSTASSVISWDDPTPPDDDKEWELVSSSIGALRNSEQPILWFWKLINKE